MRELPEVEALAGTAEALPLADASVDAVVAGEAFHWFDLDRAPAELARVLRPGGALAIFSNTPDGAPPEGWGQPLGDLLAAARPPHPGFDDDGTLYARMDATGLFTPLERIVVPHLHRSDRAGLVASIASMSFVALLPDAERADLLGRADALLRDHGVETVDLAMKTTVRTARRLAD